MKIYVPNYYLGFNCIADKCKHNCCIGWEIDIDNNTLSYYKKISGPFGDKINNSICCTNGTYHFELDKNERCPHLNSSNLCNIITNLGKDSLCQICKDHPRFRNFFETREEIGLGLCCEEAARIILTNKDKFHLTDITPKEIDAPSDTRENDFFKLREKILNSAEKIDKFHT